MSSKNNPWRSFIAFLDNNPVIDSLLEMTIVVSTTFVPFAIAAYWPSMYPSTDTAPSASVWSSFISFFSRGELSFSLLAVCGTIIWIFYIKAAVASKIGKTIMGLTIALLVILGLGVIAGNPGFSRSPTPSTLTLLIAGYVVAVILWFVALLRSKMPPSGETSVDETDRAKTLLQKAGRAAE